MALRFWRYNSIVRMRGAALASVLVVLGSHAAFAQDPPPPLPHVVVDLQGLIPVFPNDSQQLADSRLAPGGRRLTIPELPGAGFGGRAGLHLYLLKYRAITFGIGGEVTLGKSSSTPADTTSGLVAVDERLLGIASQLSLNFGSGHGWSYLSGGIGRSQWSLRAAGAANTNADTEALPTVNYGGGARWFAKAHLAFSLDVRLYEIQPGSFLADRPGSPRTRLLVVGAGISLK
jgi:hypothetical protein